MKTIKIRFIIKLRKFVYLPSQRPRTINFSMHTFFPLQESKSHLLHLSWHSPVHRICCYLTTQTPFCLYLWKSHRSFWTVNNYMVMFNVCIFKHAVLHVYLRVGIPAEARMCRMHVICKYEFTSFRPQFQIKSSLYATPGHDLYLFQVSCKSV